MKRKKIFFYITDAGGGHRGSAESLKAAVEKRRLPWDIRVVNIYREVWTGVEPGQRYFGFGGEDLYNFLLKRDWLGPINLLKKTTHYFSRLFSRKGAEALSGFLQREKPDFCLSLMPFINDILARGHEEAGVPLGLVVTDLVDTPPMWLTPGISRTARFVAVGGTLAAGQARRAGFKGQILNSGLIIHPKHFEARARALSQAAARKRFGLEKGLFTVLVVMGGYGGSVIGEFARRFEGSRERWQIVACCGRNEKLKAGLEIMAFGLKNRLVAVGFTKELHLLMRAVDVVVTKPGPATIMEAVAMGAPMVLDCAETMEQELPNIEMVEKGGLGLACRDRRLILQSVEALCQDPRRLASMRAKIKARAPKDAAEAIIRAMRQAL